MKMYVFEYLSKVSDNYHEGGGLAVVANDKEQVEKLVASKGDIVINEKGWEKVKVYELDGDYEPAVFVFPDAGCC